MPRLGDRRRHHADPRRARLRDRAVAPGARRRAGAGRAHDARLPHQQDLRGLVARSCTSSWPARPWTSTSRSRAPSSTPRSRSAAKLATLPQDGGLLRLVVPVALARLGTLAPLRRVRRPGDAPALRGAVAAASSRAQSFHGMVVYQGRLQNKQAFLFRLVDVANELFAMAASDHAREGHGRRRPPGGAGGAASWPTSSAAPRGARSRRLFHDLWSNDDVAKYKTALRVLDGKHLFVEAGIVGLACAGEGAGRLARPRGSARGRRQVGPRPPRPRPERRNRRRGPRSRATGHAF